MKRYTLFCTPEQTRKAIELGAPIDIFGSEDITRELVKTATEECQLDEVEKELNDYDHATIIGELAYCMPTAEEMIGWLEEKIYFSDITIEKYEHHWRWFIFGKCRLCGEDKKHNSRKEATLAAIDTALEYLSNKQK